MNSEKQEQVIKVLEELSPAMEFLRVSFGRLAGLSEYEIIRDGVKEVEGENNI